MSSSTGKIALWRRDKELVLLLYDFDVDSPALKLNHRMMLGHIAPFIGVWPDMHVYFEGHASRTGTEKHNKALSEIRANTAMAYLKYRSRPGLPQFSVVRTPDEPGRSESGQTRAFIRPPPRYESTAVGEKHLVSQSDALKNRLDVRGRSQTEDERDRSVVIRIRWAGVQRLVTIRPGAWDEAFQEANFKALVDAFVMCGGALEMVSAAPAPTHFGKMSQLTEAIADDLIGRAAGGPCSEEEIGRITKEQTIQRMMEAVRRQRLGVSREEVARRYDEWFSGRDVPESRTLQQASSAEL